MLLGRIKKYWGNYDVRRHIGFGRFRWRLAFWALTKGIRPWTFQSATQNHQYATSQTTHRTPSRATSPCLSGRHLKWRQRSLPSYWTVSTYSKPCGPSVVWDFSTPLLGREYYTLRKLWRIHSDDSPKAHWTKSTTSVVLWPPTEANLLCRLGKRVARNFSPSLCQAMGTPRQTTTENTWTTQIHGLCQRDRPILQRHTSYCIDLFSEFIDSQRTDESTLWFLRRRDSMRRLGT